MSHLSTGWDRTKQHEATRRWRSTPRGKYTDSRQNAIRRGIEWALSYDQWWALWEPHWEQRGRNGLMMCRIKEPGPYHIDNLYIGTASQNQTDRRKNEEEDV